MGDSPASVLVDPADGASLKVVTDGSDRKLDITTKVRKADGTIVNPATEDTLALIKNTDGIKKITDPLPAGTNNIGDVDIASALPAGTNNIGDVDIASALPAGTNEIGKIAQGTRAAAAAGWPVYVVDSSGNAVGVILDGAVYRFAVDSKIGKGTTDLVHLDSIDTSTGRGRLKATLYTQDGDPIAFGSVPPSPEEIYNKFCLNGSSESLLVNGSSTPVIFTYPAHATEDISLQEIKFVLSANGITFGTNYFGGVAGPLTNGLLVEITADGHTGTVFNLKQNESFVNFASPGGFEWVVSSKDLMAATYSIGGGFKLKGGTADCITVTVRDNLSSAGTYFKCFVKGHLLPI